MPEATADSRRGLVARLVTSPVTGRLMPTSLVVLRYVSRTGATITFAVQAARDTDRLLVVVGNADRKRWWRHFRTPAPVEVCLHGGWFGAVGRVVDAGAAPAYRRRFPHSPASAVYVELTCADLPAEVGPLRGWRLWRRWFGVVTAGEVVGFCVPATIGALTVHASAAVVLATIVAAGAVEGMVLGAAQASVLRRAVSGVAARAWVAATAGAAAVAYAIGMLPSTLAGLGVDLSPSLWFTIGPVLGVALLLSIGTAQWLVLRRVLPRFARWIGVTAAAWTVGLAVFLGFAMPLWHPGQPASTVIGIGVVGGLLMAATTSAITGEGLRRLLAAGSRSVD